MTTGPVNLWQNHDGNMFSAPDADNDESIVYHCAALYFGGWWYTDCYYGKLTGLWGENVADWTGMCWEAWLGEFNYLQYADMKVQLVP